MKLHGGLKVELDEVGPENKWKSLACRFAKLTLAFLDEFEDMRQRSNYNEQAYQILDELTIQLSEEKTA